MVGTASARDYVFLYLGLVAVLGTLTGLRSALTAAALSFVLVDYFFLPPCTASPSPTPATSSTWLVFRRGRGRGGGVGSGRRRAQIERSGSAPSYSTPMRSWSIWSASRRRRRRSRCGSPRPSNRCGCSRRRTRLRSDLLANVSHELRNPAGEHPDGATTLLARPAPPRPRTRRCGGDHRPGSPPRAARLRPARHGPHRGTRPDPRPGGDRPGRRRRRGRRPAAPGIPGRPVAIDLPPDGLEVLADWDRLGQILDNLLQNANRHAPSGTPITVEAAPGKRSMIIVRVIDQGPGVAGGAAGADLRALRARLPGGETEAHARGAVSRGTGLGLAIVRGLVEAHAAGCGSRIRRRARGALRVHPPRGIPTDPRS